MMERTVGLLKTYQGRLIGMIGLFLISGFHSPSAIGKDAVTAVTKELLALMNSRDWFCKYDQKVNLNHLSDGNVAKVGVSFALIRCIYSGPGVRQERPFWRACRAASPNTILSLEDCIVADIKDAPAGDITWGEAAESPEKSSRVVDKWGRICKYADQPLQLSRRSEKEPGRFDWLCATPISCDNYDRGPKHFIDAFERGISMKYFGSRLYKSSENFVNNVGLFLQPRQISSKKRNACLAKRKLPVGFSIIQA